MRLSNELCIVAVSYQTPTKQLRSKLRIENECRQIVAIVFENIPQKNVFFTYYKLQAICQQNHYLVLLQPS